MRTIFGALRVFFGLMLLAMGVALVDAFVGQDLRPMDFVWALMMLALFAGALSLLWPALAGLVSFGRWVRLPEPPTIYPDDEGERQRHGGTS